MQTRGCYMPAGHTHTKYAQKPMPAPFVYKLQVMLALGKLLQNRVAANADGCAGAERCL